MRAKTSFFNKTVFKKNLTRFAPVWVVYALGLCILIIMQYSNETSFSEYNKLLGFVRSFASDMVAVSMLWNLAYALLAAQLLFGDLYNSRMCNALHAMPLRRETWFATNCLSGMFFSLIPTFVGALVLIPMLNVSIVENAWVMALLWFLVINLQYICCFGIAAFATMCVGSRLTMAAGYGLLHFGAYIAYWLVDTVYTPMLYGVQTPSTLVENLTPMAHMVGHDYIDLNGMVYEYEIREQNLNLSNLTVSFTLTQEWWRIFAVAGVGLLFVLLALLLYRKRDLECAGDAVAFPILKPVFQVLCALFVMCAGEFVVSYVLLITNFSMVIMALGLILGWFVAKMLIERSTRVFRLKNWYGLGALAVCIALTLVATHFDILNIEERLPNKDKIENVLFETNQTVRYEMDESQWDDIIRIHELAVADRVEGLGLYVIQADGSRVRYASDEYIATTSDKDGATLEDTLGYEGYVQAGQVRITYEMKDGSFMMRQYPIWSDGEIGDLTKKALSDWEVVTSEKVQKVGGKEMKALDAAMDGFLRLSVTGDYYNKDLPKVDDRKEAESFLEAVKKDCEAGLMIQDGYFHRGILSREVTDDYTDETYYDTREELYVTIEGQDCGWDVRVYPDCVNTMQWLTDRGLLVYDVYPDAVVLPG